MVIVESKEGNHITIGMTRTSRADWYRYCRKKGKKPSDHMVTVITEVIDMKKYCSSLFDMTLLQYLIKSDDPKYVVLSGSAIRFSDDSLAEFGSVVLTFEESDRMIIINDSDLISKLGDL